MTDLSVVLSDEEARVAEAVSRVAVARRELEFALAERDRALQALPTQQPIVMPGFLPQSDTPVSDCDECTTAPRTPPTNLYEDSEAGTPFVQPWPH